MVTPGATAATKKGGSKAKVAALINTASSAYDPRQVLPKSNTGIGIKKKTIDPHRDRDRLAALSKPHKNKAKLNTRVLAQMIRAHQEGGVDLSMASLTASGSINANNNANTTTISKKNNGATAGEKKQKKAAAAAISASALSDEDLLLELEKRGKLAAAKSSSATGQMLSPLHNNSNKTVEEKKKKKKNRRKEEEEGVASSPDSGRKSVAAKEHHISPAKQHHTQHDVSAIQGHKEEVEEAEDGYGQESFDLDDNQESSQVGLAPRAPFLTTSSHYHKIGGKQQQHSPPGGKSIFEDADSGAEMTMMRAMLQQQQMQMQQGSSSHHHPMYLDAEGTLDDNINVMPEMMYNMQMMQELQRQQQQQHNGGGGTFSMDMAMGADFDMLAGYRRNDDEEEEEEEEDRHHQQQQQQQSYHSQQHVTAHAMSLDDEPLFEPHQVEEIAAGELSAEERLFGSGLRLGDSSATGSGNGNGSAGEEPPELNMEDYMFASAEPDAVQKSETVDTWSPAVGAGRHSGDGDDFWEPQAPGQRTPSPLQQQQPGGNYNPQYPHPGGNSNPQQQHFTPGSGRSAGRSSKKKSPGTPGPGVVVVLDPPSPPAGVIVTATPISSACGTPKQTQFTPGSGGGKPAGSSGSKKATPLSERKGTYSVLCASFSFYL
jgi:hypothetical protein